MTIDETGNVGIGGTASTTNKLKVTGTVEATTVSASTLTASSYVLDGMTHQQTIRNSAAKSVGWYRIAENGNAVNSTVNSGSRCSARFTIMDYDSGKHSTRTFYAGGTYGKTPYIHLLTNTSYASGGSIRYVRVVEDNTYEGLAVEIYVDTAVSANEIRVVMDDNYQSTGFTLINFESVVADHAGMNEYSIDLDTYIWAINRDGANQISLDTDGTVTAATFSGALSGNASTAGSAATLTTAQYIGGVSFDGSAAIDLPGVNTGGNQNTTGTSGGITFTEVDVTAPDVTSGTWAVSASSNYWGPPKFNTSYNKYAQAVFNIPAGTAVYRQWNIPTGMKSAYISQLTWSDGGYLDVHGVQSDGGLVFLRRVNTRQSVENSHEGSTQYDGSTISFIGSGLDSFSSIRITNKLGKVRLTGLAFTPTLDGTEGTGMVHPQQLATTLSASQIPTLNQNTTGTAGDADTVDGQHAHEMSWGHDTAHGTYTDFNTFLNTDKFGAHYITGTTNGPGQSGPTQYYHQRMALGSGHNQYSLQLAIGRGRTDNYLWYRNEENSSASSWYKMRAGYADSAGSATSVTGKSSISKTAHTAGANDYHLELVSGNTGDANKEVSLRFHQGSQYWGQIRFRASQFYFTDGSTNAFISINTGNISSSGYVFAAGYMTVTMTARYYNGSGNSGNYTGSRNISVWAEHHMRCSEMQVTSDRRIKTDIVDVDDGSALTLLRKIQPRTYGYVDKVNNGEGRVYGFIAQEIKELIPDAVDVSEGDLPNIYKHATIDIQANSITIKDFDTSTLNQTDSIIYIDQDDQRQTLKIKSIINSTQLEIEEDLEKVVETFKTSKMEEYTFTGEIFIWGQKVQDFHHLKKSAIFTVTTAALQEVDRQLQAEKIKTHELRQKVELLEMSHGALIQRVEALEKL